MFPHAHYKPMVTPGANSTMDTQNKPVCKLTMLPFTCPESIHCHDRPEASRPSPAPLCQLIYCNQPRGAERYSSAAGTEAENSLRTRGTSQHTGERHTPLPVLVQLCFHLVTGWMRAVLSWIHAQWGATAFPQSTPRLFTPTRGLSSS